MEQRKGESDTEKLKEYKAVTDAYLKYYRLLRSMEFLKQADMEAAWKKIEQEKQWRTFRKSMFAVMKMASMLALVVSMAYFAASYWSEEQKVHRVDDFYAESRFPETGGKKAVLRLDNGQEIDLAGQEGVIQVSDNTVAVSKQGESLSYVKNDEKAGNQHPANKEEIRYNTLQVPRGGEYQLVLEDGTKVWLNAESTLRYPTDFSFGREVALTGEAYFEVTKDTQHPFIVQVGGNRVEVLGTKFNVSAYPQHSLYATLVEGCVRLNSTTNSVVLQPNEQAVVAASGNIGVRVVDASVFTAWTQGRYEFRETELEDIADQLSRWYDVDIRFREEKLKSRRFAGVIFRNDELTFAIEVIEEVSDVKFVREGNVIYITR